MTSRTHGASRAQRGRSARATKGDWAEAPRVPALRCTFRKECGTLRMRWVRLAQALCLLAAALPVAAQAKVYVEAQPRVSLGAGYDDNVKFDGAGGDGLGEATPGLKLEIFGEHAMRTALDCQASIARLVHPERVSNDNHGFANSALCRADFRDHVAETLRTHWFARATYARDAFAISSLGLLLRAGQTQVFQARVAGSLKQELSARSALEYGIFADALNFGANDPGNGYQLAPQIGFGYRTTSRNTVDVTAREQLFFGAGATAVPGQHGAGDSGLLAEGTSLLAGFTRRLTPIMTATVRGGPILITRPTGAVLGPVGRFELSADAPTSGVHFVIAHDLVLGPSHAGALTGDVAELGGFTDLIQKLGAHGRAGVYRNTDVGAAFDRVGTIGYSAEVGLDWHFTREWSLGVAALRDARLTDRFGFNVDRDVFQVRLSWEKARN